MNMLSKKVLRITGWLIIAVIVFFAARRIGHDAQFIQKKHEIMRTTAGQSLMNRLVNLRAQRFADTIEEPVRFTSRIASDSTDRIERKGILVRRPHARAVVLICHGFMCNKDDVRFLRGVLFSDYTTFSFDFRAHGECTAGQTCTFGSGEKEDVIGAVEYIKSLPDLRSKPIIVYGFSMGAVASILAQADRHDLFDGAIWDCPFDSTDNLIERMINQINISVGGYAFGMPGKNLLRKYAYNAYVQDLIKMALKTAASLDGSTIATHMLPVDVVQAAKKVTIPSYFIVCKKDTKAPVSAVMSVYHGARGFKRLWITNGRFHFDSFFFNPEKYAYKVIRFIEKLLDNRLDTEVRERIDIDENAKKTDPQENIFADKGGNTHELSDK